MYSFNFITNWKLKRKIYRCIKLLFKRLFQSICWLDTNQTQTVFSLILICRRRLKGTVVNPNWSSLNRSSLEIPKNSLINTKRNFTLSSLFVNGNTNWKTDLYKRSNNSAIYLKTERIKGVQRGGAMGANPPGEVWTMIFRGILLCTSI